MRQHTKIEILTFFAVIKTCCKQHCSIFTIVLSTNHRSGFCLAGMSNISTANLIADMAEIGNAAVYNFNNEWCVIDI